MNDHRTNANAPEHARTWEKICEAEKDKIACYQAFIDRNGWCDPPLPVELALPFTRPTHLRLGTLSDDMDGETAWRTGRSLIQHAHTASLAPDPARIIEHARTIALRFKAPVGNGKWAHAVLQTYWDWDNNAPAHLVTALCVLPFPELPPRPDQREQWPLSAQTGEAGEA